MYIYSQLQGTTQCSYVFDQRLRCVGCTARLFCLFVSSELQIKKKVHQPILSVSDVFLVVMLSKEKTANS